MDLLLLLIVGSVLLCLEFFLPSFGTLSIMAVLCYAYAIFLAFSDFGLVAGLLISALCVIVAIFAIAMGLKFLPKMKLTKSLSLDTKESQPENSALEYVGKSAIALTDMSPTGRVLVDGKTFEAQSELGFIEKESPLVITGGDNFRLTVKKSEK